MEVLSGNETHFHTKPSKREEEFNQERNEKANT
jgi:hypothetical protein